MPNASTLDPSSLDRFICAVIPMVDTTRWGVPARIVAAVARLQAESEDGWAHEGWREIARRANCSPRYAWDLVGGGKGKGTLWRVDWVLVRGRVGAGRRATELRVNDDITRWRNVPWIEKNAELRTLRAEAALDDPQTWIWRDLDRAAKGRKWRDPDRAAKGPAGAARRHGPDVGSTPLRRDQDRATSSGQRRDQDRATTNAASAPSTNATAGLKLLQGGVSKTSSTAQEQQQGICRTDADHLVERLVVAINRKCQANGGGTVYRASSLVTRLRRLAVDVDVDVLLAGVEKAPVECGPPLVVAFLEDLARGTVTLDAATGQPSGLDIEARLATLARLIATYEDDDDALPELLAERQRWETELDQRKELLGGHRDAPQCEPSPVA